MTEIDLHLKLEKCCFATTKVEYLGVSVKPGQLAMDPINLDGIASWPTSKKVKDAKSFLGFATFTPVLSPTIPMLPDSSSTFQNKSSLGTAPSYQTSFHTLKSLFLLKPILYLPDLATPFAIAIDAFKYALGAILLQTDSNGNWHPYSYLSQSFFPAEWNYNIYDSELLTVICTLKLWQHYLHGSPFPVQVFMDHKNLTYFHTPQALNCQQA